MPEPIWDERLLTRERALELVGSWPLVCAEHPGEQSVHLHCQMPRYARSEDAAKRPCYQSVFRMLPGYRINLEALLSSVLRHAVTAHDLDTGGRDARTGESPRHLRGGPRRGLDPHPSHRSPTEELDPERGGEPPGGDAA